jgi:hypothetical protein
MQVRELIDRSASFFGREPDLTHLRQRSQRQGLTAVVARAQMGKSTLLMELARQLSYDPAPNLFGPQPRLIGFTESAGETADVMLRAITDLYLRWLSNSNYRQQAKVIYEQQKDDFIGKTGEAIGSIFKDLSKTVGLEAIGGLVNETFKGLASANRDLQTGELQTPRLQIEQAQELVTILHKITKRHIILVFDQWEKSLNTQLESNVLDSFLRHRDEWPPCHIFLGLRPEGVPYEAVLEFQSAYPAAAEVYDLPPMHLEGNSASLLLSFIRERVAVTNNLSDDELLNVIAGYPETVNRWTDATNTAPKTSLEDLTRIADDANSYRFREFKKLLPSLSDEARLLAMRLSLLSATKDPETWRTLKPLLLEGTQPKNLDTLKSTGVLVASAPPTYGHIKRTDAARRWFIENCQGELSQVCELLIYSLAGHIRTITSQDLPYAESLVEISSLSSALDLAEVAQALCQSALSAFALPLTAPNRLLGVTADLNATPQSVAPLLATGLFNTLVDAKAENDLKRRDALLSDLQTLAHDHPEDDTVRKQLAKGIFNTLIHAKEENNLQLRDALLAGLQTLALDHPEDTTVRDRLAKSLYNTMIHAKGENNLPRRDALFADLRTLALNHPEDASVRERLANALFNALYDAKEENDLPRRDALLSDLQTLARVHPEDATVREQLANALLNTLIYAKEENDLPRRDALLIELRTLALNHPQDASVRKQLAMGVVNTLNHAKDENDLTRRDALLIELRTLARDHPSDATVRDVLVRGLFGTLNDAKQENDLQRRDALLADLRTLAHDYPEDAVVRENFAMGLFNTMHTLKGARDFLRMRTELSELISAHPEEPISIKIAPLLDGADNNS